MLNDRIEAHVQPLLRPGETIRAAMAGFRPLSRSWALISTFPLVLGGFAVATATGLPAWVGGALGGGTGAGLAMVLDQRQARAEHGKGMSVGLVVTSQRLFVLELETGVFLARVAGIETEAELGDITGIEAERMQGSGLRRAGAAITFRDGSRAWVIPARTDAFLDAVGAA